jgi:hypothetical protein
VFSVRVAAHRPPTALLTRWMNRDRDAPQVCEVLAVNTVAPFILNSRLKTLMTASPFADRYALRLPGVPTVRLACLGELGMVLLSWFLSVPCFALEDVCTLFCLTVTFSFRICFSKSWRVWIAKG